LKDPFVEGETILIWILEKWDGGAWTELLWLRLGTVERLL
jgi:hypothetical protein